MKTCDQEAEDTSCSSPVKYCETVYDTRIQKETSVFHLDSTFETHASIGKRLCHNSCERREVVKEARRIASLPLIDCRSEKPLLNEPNLQYVRRSWLDIGISRDELHWDRTKCIRLANEPLVAKLACSYTAQTASSKEGFNAKNDLSASEKDSASTNICNFATKLAVTRKTNSLSCRNIGPSHKNQNFCVHANNVVTVTSFGPNETINTELW